MLDINCTIGRNQPPESFHRHHFASSYSFVHFNESAEKAKTSNQITQTIENHHHFFRLLPMFIHNLISFELIVISSFISLSIFIFSCFTSFSSLPLYDLSLKKGVEAFLRETNYIIDFNASVPQTPNERSFIDEENNYKLYVQKVNDIKSKTK